MVAATWADAFGITGVLAEGSRTRGRSSAGGTLTKTILVADDSKTIRRVVEMTFEKTGFEVVCTASAHEALERAPSVGPAVVLADVAMPDGDGYSLCTTLKSQATTAHVPVLLLAGSGEPVDETKAQLARADGHIKKPFDSGDLIDLVRRVTGEVVDADVPKSFAATLSQRTPDGVLTPRAPEPAPSPPEAEPDLTMPLEAPPSLATAQPRSADLPVVSEDLPVVSEDIEVDDDLLIEEVDPDEAPLGPSLEPPAPPPPAGERPSVDMWALAEGGEPPAGAIEEIDIEDEPEELSIEEAVELSPPVAAPPAPVAPVADLGAPEEGPGTFEAPTRDIHADDPTRDVGKMPDLVASTAQAAAPKIADAVAPAAPGLSKEELTAIARDVIEQIAWEVVPDLAESIIREELKRLTTAD